MLEFIEFVRDIWNGIFDVFDSSPLVIGGYSVSYPVLVFAFLVIGFAISYFWKGAKS